MMKFVKYMSLLALLSSLSLASAEEKSSQCSSQKQLTLKIDSAACENACAKLDKVLTNLEGVKAESCSKSHFTKVSYDASKVKAEQVFAAFKKAGVKIEGQQVEFDVSGMVCGACCTKLSKSLAALDGVLNGSACHKKKKAIVLFDPAKLQSDQIVAAIHANGYKVEKAAEAN